MAEEIGQERIATMKFEIWQLFVFIFVVAILFASVANLARYPEVGMAMYAACICGLLLFVSRGLRQTHINNKTQGAALIAQKLLEMAVFGVPLCLTAGFVLTFLIETLVDLLFGPSIQRGFTLYHGITVFVGIAYLYWHFKQTWSSK